MKYTQWKYFSRYKKRWFEINYMGTQVNLDIAIYPKSKISQARISWTCKKFPGSIYKFEMDYSYGPKSFKPVFTRIRKSLSYGLNPKTQHVVNRLHGFDPSSGKPHPIHKRAQRLSLHRFNSR